jgi:hypothetical protein
MRFNPHLNHTPAPLPPAKPASIVSPAVTPSPGTGFPITVTKNERNGIEIRFPTKPDEPTREHLKRQGFRWHGGRGCWYHRFTPENWLFANGFLAAPAAPSPVPAIIPPANIVTVDFKPAPTTAPVPVITTPVITTPTRTLNPLLARMLQRS